MLWVCLFLSVCQWCGKSFVKKHNRQVYCCSTCRDYGYLEKARVRKVNYRKKYKEVMGEKQKYGLGSYAARLGPHRNDNFSKELFLVEKELRILKLS